jgi:hypothetical protein
MKIVRPAMRRGARRASTGAVLATLGSVALAMLTTGNADAATLTNTSYIQLAPVVVPPGITAANTETSVLPTTNGQLGWPTEINVGPDGQALTDPGDSTQPGVAVTTTTAFPLSSSRQRRNGNSN